MQQPPNSSLPQSDCQDEGRGGRDEQSQAEVRADFGSDPGILKLRLQTVPVQIWLKL